MTIQDETRFPPRADLPSAVTIPRLPLLGTAWYERGVSYWARRAGVSLMFAVILAAWTLLVGAFVRASGPDGSPAFITVLVAEIVFSLVTGGWMFHRLWKHPSQAWRTYRGPGRGAGAAAGSTGVLARAGSIVATAIFGIAVLLTYGLFLALFLRSLAPVLPTERDARRMLADELQKGHHRMPPPAPAGGHPGSKRRSRPHRR